MKTESVLSQPQMIHRVTIKLVQMCSIEFSCLSSPLHYKLLSPYNTTPRQEGLAKGWDGSVHCGILGLCTHL